MYVLVEILIFGPIGAHNRGHSTTLEKKKTFKPFHHLFRLQTYSHGPITTANPHYFVWGLLSAAKVETRVGEF